MKEAAIIDIGSNSIRYARGWAKGAGQVQMEPKQVCTTRLAEGLEASGVLGEAPIGRSLVAIGDFAADAKERGLPVFAYATSAVREGANQADFCRRIAALGVNVAVLSGEEEAILAHWGATGGKGGVVDIGGGSTQIICRNFAHSGPIGCVGAKELCASAGSLDEMRDIVFARCAALLRFPGEAEGDYTGLGGTIHTLAALLLELPAYDAAKVCAARIHPPQLKGLLDRLYTMGPKGRQAEPLLANRAETILPGGLILAYVLAKTGETSLAVSDRDGMEGYFLQKLQAGALSGGIGK